jgi:hypothetical protein
MMAFCVPAFLLPYIGFTLDPPLSIVTALMSNCSQIYALIRTKMVMNTTISGSQWMVIAMGIAMAMRHLHSTVPDGIEPSRCRHHGPTERRDCPLSLYPEALGVGR